ncbi:MAG: phosphoribosylformylglycinamidine cyclo-ligase [Erysipelotrichaceae bacterium]|nr:MAG: phosphoribosylformylglycinamidine cyclo-ligase [Erysipelotrichaceae bacterium]
MVRKILFKDNHVSLDEPFEGSTIGETILTPTKIYVKAVMAVLKEIKVSGIAHITGGGFIENMPRCLQDTQGLLITKGSWTIPPIFKKLQDLGKINESEMYNIFNMGIGMILLVDQKDLEQTLSILSTHGENAQVIGEVTNIPGIQFV